MLVMTSSTSKEISDSSAAEGGGEEVQPQREEDQSLGTKYDLTLNRAAAFTSQNHMTKYF